MLPLLVGFAALLAMCSFSVTATRSLYAPDWEGQRTFTREVLGAVGVVLTLLFGWFALRSASSRDRLAGSGGMVAIPRIVACGFVAYLLVRAADLGTALSLALM